MGGGQGRLTATIPDLGKAFDTLVKQALLAASPLVSQAEAAGAASLLADLRLDDDGRLVAEGRVEADGLGFQAPEVEVRQASLDLPFHWREGGARGQPMPPLPRDWGGFSAQAAALGPLSLQSDVPLALVPGRLYVGGFRAAVPGGAVESPGLHVDRPFSPVRVLRGTLRLPGLDFAALPSPFPLEGSLSGSLDLRMAGGRLTTEGKLGGDFFGGELTVSDIGGRGLFQSGRSIGLNARVEGMDLLPLGRAMDLGTITGRLDLMLRGLEIAYGQPVAFELVARSPGEARADRRISLKAVNALTELGTGRGMTGVGVGFFSSFFETFAYQDMGLYCRLHNDLFTVRGLIQEGGVEYIIKRPPLFGINVVNSNPGNTIRFSDMLDRLGRVLRGLDKEDS
ncbi:hypothetical protein [Desulfohalovibrio reitneri]|uniref:hypothetical protein n=1 Tax=Desulfohalovibrio reitneri TaxID=1307759 RepID=UPI0004A6FB43|nr:hypothetical protein [Desulfohalovibrio reitneri]